MRKAMGVAALAVLGLVVSASAVTAQTTATQNVTFEVQTINAISVAGMPSLTINAVGVDGTPTPASDNTATYAVTTNLTNRKITAKLDAAMPAGVKLVLQMTAPTGGTSAGSVELSTTEQDVVTGISTLSETGIGMTYQLTADLTAGVVASTTRTVTLTLTAGA